MAHPYIRLLHTSKRPCPTCEKHFGTREKSQKYCSVACKTMGMRNKASKVCVKCLVEKPFDGFPLQAPSGNRPRSCKECYTPKPRKAPRPPLKAPFPCKTCGETFYLRRSPSAVAKQRFCSTACATSSFQIKIKTCQTCSKSLRFDAFPLSPSGKGRRRTCTSCEEERGRLREQKLGYMQSFGRMRLCAITGASRNKLPYTATDEELQAIYKSPCALCGRPSCTLRRIFPELGYISGNLEGVCWLCGQLGTTKSGLLTDEVILQHARAIVRHADG